MKKNFWVSFYAMLLKNGLVLLRNFVNKPVEENSI